MIRVRHEILNIPFCPPFNHNIKNNPDPTKPRGYIWQTNVREIPTIFPVNISSGIGFENPTPTERLRGKTPDFKLGHFRNAIISAQP